MKKVTLIIVITLLVILFGITTVNAVTPTAELRANKTTVKPGEEFTIDLYVAYDNGYAVIAQDDETFIYYNYDKSKLELVNKKTNLTDYSVLETNDDNTPIEGITLEGDFSAENVYEWTFKVKENAQLGNTQFYITPVLLLNEEESNATGPESVNTGTKITVQPITITIESDSSNPGGETTDGTGSNAGQGTGENTEQDAGQGTGNNGGNTGTGTGQGSGTSSGGNNGTGTSSKGNTGTGTVTESGTKNGTETGGSTVKINKETLTQGKSPDTTTSASEGKSIPKAGAFTIKGLIFVIVIAISIVTYKKFNQLKDVK